MNDNNQAPLSFEEEEGFAHAQDPDAEEMRAYGLSLSDQEEVDCIEEMEEDDVPIEPDLDWYLSMYELTDSQKVALCRTYASFLVAKGRSGRLQPGPPSELKKKEMRRQKF